MQNSKDPNNKDGYKENTVKTTKSNSPIMKKKTTTTIIILILLIILVFSLCFIFIFFNKENVTETGNDNSLIEPDPEEPKEEEQEEEEPISKKYTFYNEDYAERYESYQQINPSLDIEKVIVYVNIGLDRSFYTDVLPSPNVDTNTVLVNKYYSLPRDYVPQNLEYINSSYSSGKRLMESTARIAFENMAKDAKSEGYNIRAMSTYRSYDYQSGLYNNYVKADGVAKADTYSARPGSSEHQTGLAVDVDNISSSYTSFGNTKEFTWMKENAYKYGFILRYTADSEFITGYKNEPWHYRYVGVEIATYIQNNPMTYEEYYVRFLAN